MQPYPLIFGNISTENLFVFGLLLICIFATFQRKTDTNSLITRQSGEQLKGIAIIAIIFIHISYELVKNWEFLHPVAPFAGVGVDLFLLLSGYGLTLSALKKPMSISKFYKKRLLRVFFPFWILVILLYIFDFLILGIHYSSYQIVQTFLVFFPTAHMWDDFNSPFWYLSWLLFFYLFFPVFFRQKHPNISVILLCLASIIFVKVDPFHMETNWLHKLHLFAFPIGMILAIHADKILKFFQKYSTRSYFGQYVFLILSIILFLAIWNLESTNFPNFVNFLSNIDDGLKLFEQIKSILLALILIFFFLAFPLQNRFLYIFGLLSYEIYLIHWPIISRYDVFFHHFPIGIATVLSIFEILVIAYFFQKMNHYIDHILAKSKS